MIRPLLSLERLSLDEKRAQVCYRYRKDAQEMDGMDYLNIAVSRAIGALRVVASRREVERDKILLRISGLQKASSQ